MFISVCVRLSSSQTARVVYVCMYVCMYGCMLFPVYSLITGTCHLVVFLINCLLI